MVKTNGQWVTSIPKVLLKTMVIVYGPLCFHCRQGKDQNDSFNIYSAVKLSINYLLKPES